MAFTAKVLLDGPRHYIVALHGESTANDGENGVIKVDRSSLVGPDKVTAPNYLAIEEITASVEGFDHAQLFWEDDGGDEIIANLSGESYYDFTNAVLSPANAPTAVTDGDIKLTTVSAGSAGAGATGDSYFIKLRLRKLD